MNERSLKLCEFDFVLEKLGELTETPMGKELALNLRPSSIKEEVISASKETEEAKRLISYEPPPSLLGLIDISSILSKARLGVILEPLELMHICNFVSRLPAVKRYIRISPFFKGLSDKLPNLSSLEDDIRRVIDDDGNIRSNASSKLIAIRKGIARLEESIRSYLENHIAKDWKDMVQENYITIRNSRYVIPVKSSYKKTIKGIVHDVSQSGNTLFIEPYDVIDMNNNLQELRKEEEYEIQRILRELSTKVASCSDELLTARDIISHIDFVFAKARLSLSWGCISPVWIDKPLVRFKSARHPILGNRAVPIDVEIGDKFDVLVISGPNTGGKTVTLKTIGLFIMMAQSGLHLPVNFAEMGIFKDVFVEIGDEQNIIQDLSSFSAHLTHIIPFIKYANENTIVLIDEPVTGTSPREGSALAISILEALRNKGAKVVVASHYDELKVWASNTERVMNGAMEFDPDTFLPTYRLCIGRPGVSNAFIIARKLGLDKSIIEKARSFLSGNELILNELLSQIDKLEKELRIELEKARNERSSYEELKDKYEKLLEEISLQQKSIIRKAKEEARDLIVRAKIRLDELYERAKSASNKKEILLIKDELKELEPAWEELEVQGNRIEKPEVGMTVFVSSLGQNGDIVDINGDKVTVLVGKARIEIPKDEIYSPKADHKEFATDNIVRIKKSKAQNISNRLSLRQLTVEEALEKLERYIDDAVLAGISPVYIIHGKGEGILRKAVANFLKDHPMVESFRLGEYYEGGWGVTVAYLKGL
ncbi:MAG: endonuclease MutS2 [bacterium]|nr:endonuclease MutS2 [bacterium]